MLKDRFDLLGHVQVADMPGRNEPGSGVIDWTSFMATLKALGYAAPVGLEYKPSTATPVTLERMHAALGI